LGCLIELVGEQVLGDGGVSGGGAVGDSEDQRQVKRVRPSGETFVEDAVLAYPVDTAAGAVHPRRHELLADPTSAVSGLVTDQDVGVGVCGQIARR
jgi:hypothetical protein